MQATSGQKRQLLLPPAASTDEHLETMLKGFRCCACGHTGVRKTERDAWYTCANCGYSFGIESRPRKRYRLIVEANNRIAH